MYKLVFLAVFFLIISCDERVLPILGERTFVSGAGKGGDTLYHTVPSFRMLDQDSAWISNETFRNKVYVADFFFTSCPTICPVVQKNLLKVSIAFGKDPNIKFLSYSIDPDHDGVTVLKRYARKLGATRNNWFFLTGNRDETFDLAEHGYYATAKKDSSAAGGFVHSGALILVDSRKHIRGVYDGTVEDDVQKLLADIPQLLREERKVHVGG